MATKSLWTGWWAARVKLTMRCISSLLTDDGSREDGKTKNTSRFRRTDKMNKVIFNLEQATKFHRASRCTAVIVRDGWSVRSTLQEVVWESGAMCVGAVCFRMLKRYTALDTPHSSNLAQITLSVFYILTCILNLIFKT